MQKLEMLDQIESACIRAEKNGKDKDLLIALKAIFMLLRENINNEQQKTGNGV